MRWAPLLLLFFSTVAFAQDRGGVAPLPERPNRPSNGPPPAAVMEYSRLWPLTLNAQVLVGAEFHGERGNPVAFGVETEVMWHGRLGGFAAVLSSEGTPILPHSTGMTMNGMPVTDPSLGDRISIPFGLVYRPFVTLGRNAHFYLRRFLDGIGVQAGLTVEHVRTSDDSATNAGLHLGASLELPLYRGPLESGLTLRIYGRMIATPEVKLDTRLTQFVEEPNVSGQIFAGLVYYP